MYIDSNVFVKIIPVITTLVMLGLKVLELSLHSLHCLVNVPDSIILVCEFVTVLWKLVTSNPPNKK